MQMHETVMGTDQEQSSTQGEQRARTARGADRLLSAGRRSDKSATEMTGSRR